MFFELLKTADTTATEQKRVITYKADGNGTKTCRKGLVSLAKIFNDKSIIGLYAEPIQADFSDDLKSVIIYRDFDPCIEISTIYNDAPVEAMRNALQRYNKAIPNYAAYAEDVKNTVINGGFIKNTVLHLLREKGDTELYRNALRVKQERAEATEKAERAEAEKRAEEERKQKQAEAEERRHRHAEKMDFLLGYAEGRTQIQVERIYNILAKVQSYAEGGKITYKSRRDFIKDIIAEGGKIEQRDGVVSYYGSKWDPKQSKPKTEYRLYGTDNSYYAITKTEYDFGKYLMSLEG